MPTEFSSAVRQLVLVAGLVAAAAAGSAGAADFPERPITLVTPFPEGGASDVVTRILARKLEQNLGQAVVVENRPGAGTVTGATHVALAKPDGYTLLLSSNSTFALNPALQARLPYDAAKGFDAIGLVGSVALVVLVHPSVVATTVPALVAAAKAAPARFVYGSFGNGTSSNFAGAMFNSATGLSMTHVPYRGSAPLMADLIGGQIPVAFDTVVSAAPQVKAGKVKAIAVTTSRRSALLPGVPTVAESGYPDFELAAWIAVVGPHGMPAEVRARLAQSLAAVMAQPDTQERMKAAGFDVGFQQVPDWPVFVTTEIARMRGIAERARISAE